MKANPTLLVFKYVPTCCNPSETHRLTMFPSHCGTTQSNLLRKPLVTSELDVKWLWGIYFSSPPSQSLKIRVVNFPPGQSCPIVNKNSIVPKGGDSMAAPLKPDLLQRTLLHRIGKCVAIVHVIFFL